MTTTYPSWPGLTTIHVFASASKDVDARHKAGHDAEIEDAQ
jgi:hypothetical protein